MAWFFDEYSKYDGFSPACVTGKPLDLHGTHGREAATGRGCVIAAAELLAAAGEGGLVGKRVAVQGYGNVGSWAAHFLHAAGAKVVAVSDRDGALINEGGLDIPALRRHTRASPPFGGRLVTFPGGTPAPRAALFGVACDVLIPAAVTGALDARTASQVTARFVVEAANAPTTPAGDAILRERGVTVLPDILASGGGVVVSFLEWCGRRGGTGEEREVEGRGGGREGRGARARARAGGRARSPLFILLSPSHDATPLFPLSPLFPPRVQNQQSMRWSEEEVNARLEASMAAAFRAVWATAQAQGLPLRTAAFMEALQRVTQAHLHRGFD